MSSRSTRPEIGGLVPEEFDPQVAAETRLRYGTAIAPVEAGHCIFDAFRTRAFATGVIDAIEHRRRVDPTRPVRVVYAGCGPFASLLLPACVQFGPDELQCTLIDLHDRSVASVRRVVTALGFDRHIVAIEQADATSYVLTDQVDVIVVECMLRGLSREPQVAITWNLVNQAGADVILVPEGIRLYLCAVDTGELAPSQPEIAASATSPSSCSVPTPFTAGGPSTIDRTRCPPARSDCTSPLHRPTRSWSRRRSPSGEMSS